MIEYMSSTRVTDFGLFVFADDILDTKQMIHKRLPLVKFIGKDNVALKGQVSPSATTFILSFSLSTSMSWMLLDTCDDCLAHDSVERLQSFFTIVIKKMRFLPSKSL